MSVKKCVLMLWKGKYVPNVKMWLADFVTFVAYRSLKILSTVQQSNFINHWSILKKHIDLRDRPLAAMKNMQGMLFAIIDGG